MTGLNNAFPQYGIIMEVQGQQAQLFIPLSKQETGLISTCVRLDASMLGKEAIVIFVNGDRNQGVILGVIQDE